MYLAAYYDFLDCQGSQKVMITGQAINKCFDVVAVSLLCFACLGVLAFKDRYMGSGLHHKTTNTAQRTLKLFYKHHNEYCIERHD